MAINSKITMERVLGADLRVGDVIEVWWANHWDTITALRPYTGTLAYIFPEGAQIAEFALCSGMTIDNGDYYNIIVRGASPR